MALFKYVNKFIGMLIVMSLICMSISLCSHSKGEGNVTPSGEFNFYSDPEAAKIVLTELGCSITLICWELCLKNKILWVKLYL